MLDVAGDVERTILRKLGVPLDVQTTFLATVGSIYEGVRCACYDFDFDSLAVLDMYGCTGIGCRHVRQGQTAEFNRCLITAGHVEPAVGG